MEDYEAWEWPDPEKPGEVLSCASDAVPDGLTVPKDKKVTVQQRRKLNAKFDASKKYVTREDRPEWVIVGLLGQVPVLKGQPVGDRWIKMGDISPSVEMWLIR
jgi:hypothetical protein